LALVSHEWVPYGLQGLMHNIRSTDSKVGAR
jgi:hypothetical protein